jgi:DNA polymerase-1
MRLLALDANSIINRAYYGVRPLTTKDGQYTNALYGFLHIFARLKEQAAPDAIVAAFDRHAPTFRHKMYDGYKAGRKGMPEELRSQMPILKELLPLLGCHIVELDGFEAPKFKMDKSITDFYAFTKDSFKMEGYKFHPFNFEIPMAI